MNVETLLAKVQDGANAGRSFGPVIEGDGCLIIPVAVHAGGGGGGGSEGQGVESGSGGGFGSVSWPIGVYVVRDGTARWVPALDATRLALGTIALVRTLLRLRARRRAG